jgi:hypothetical protein
MKQGADEEIQEMSHDVHFSVVKSWQGYAAFRFWNEYFLLEKGRAERVI